MISPSKSLRLTALACLLVLLLFLVGGGSIQKARAESFAQPAYQDDYPGPEDAVSTTLPDDSGFQDDYPAMEATGEPAPGEAGSENADPTAPPAVSTPTIGSELVRTHQPPLATVGPLTPLAEETTAPTETPVAKDLAGAGSDSTFSEAQSGLSIDWGLFWIGFSLPVLVGCGIVLYLMDRQPNLFRKRPKK